MPQNKTAPEMEPAESPLGLNDELDTERTSAAAAPGPDESERMDDEDAIATDEDDLEDDEDMADDEDDEDA